ncbi:Rxlr-like protein, partial [Globisporangium splendens]
MPRDSDLPVAQATHSGHLHVILAIEPSYPALRGIVISNPEPHASLAYPLKVDTEPNVFPRVAAVTPSASSSTTPDHFTRRTSQDLLQARGRLPPWRWTAQVFLVVMVLSALEFTRVTLRSTLFEWHKAKRTPRAAPAQSPLACSLSEYECVSWTETSSCSAGRTELRVQACNETIVARQTAGFCELRHRTTGRPKRVMHITCDALAPGVTFKCADFYTYLSLGHTTSTYEFDPDFSYQKCRQNLHYEQHQGNRHGSATVSPGSVKFEKGIALVADERGVASAYASIRSLRRMGCTLPIELWYSFNETIRENRIVQELLTTFGVYLQQIKDPRFFGSGSRAYAALYSAFDKVLIMEPDIFATSDPTYLFSSSNFTRKGAIFWPEYSSPHNRASSELHNASFVWNTLNVERAQLVKQETGHVLINRQRNYKALNILMYFVLHSDQFASLRVFPSDNDFFRLAWLVAKSPFYLVDTPAGNAGTALPEQGLFCGGSIVQHDPQRQVLFVRRSQQLHWQEKILWRHIHQLKVDNQPNEYQSSPRGDSNHLLEGKCCFELGRNPQQRHEATTISDFPFADMEGSILTYFEEAAKLAAVTRAINTGK